MEKLFDSHAHYFDSRFEQEGGVDTLLAALFADRVGYVINIGTNIENSKVCIAQAARYPQMYCTVGIHPSDGQEYADADTALAELEQLLGTPDTRCAQKIVALGEIGLDYHYDDTDKDRQAYVFEEQMEMAQRHGLPVVIHDREAHGDCFETVLRHPEVRGVFHSYSGSAEMARELVRRGWYLSFSGTLTFKNAERVRAAAAVVPRDRLLIETDAPYLAPHPHRGKLNHSGLLVHSLEILAQLWSCTPEEAAQITAQNAETLFF